jgi:serine/threonine-protein kinase HipA
MKMKLRKISSLTVKYHGDTVGTLALTPDNKLCAFQYAASWLINGFSISPFELPLQSDLFIAKSHPFAGNFGIFEDSLPDGYGRYLIHKALLKEGINDFELSSLERLSMVGNNGMGALTYEPNIYFPKGESVTDFDLLQRKALEVLSEKNDDDANLLLFNSMNSGGCRPKTLFSDESGHWLLKFRHTYDPKDMGVQEFNYNQAAKRAGIDVPDFKLVGNKYFAVRRFDILPNGERVHIATAGALLGISLDQPVLDYSNLLALTGVLTKNPKCVEEMFRRMIFNYVTDNKDDHCKNFSFYVRMNDKSEWQWHLAPAYDLTHCEEGYNGEHATSVNGKGSPKLEDFIILAEKVYITRDRALKIISDVQMAAKEITCKKYL